MEMESIQVLVGGTAGSGSLTGGTIIARALTRLGYYVIGVNEYPSIIRGGHTAYWVRAGVEEIYELDDKTDIVVALDQATIDKHGREFTDSTIIIRDPVVVKKVPKDTIVYDIPLQNMVKEYRLDPIVMNMIAVGVVASILGIPIDVMYKAIEDQFPGREKPILMNKKALTIGYEYASTNKWFIKKRLKEPIIDFERIIVTGNEAIVLGMIKAGVRFYAAYPMTPASPILHYMVRVSRDKDIIVVQAESEIAAAQMALGAAWAGLRAATGTSGGGFALMNESLSMAGMIEAPLVIILAMRSGPSTGMATMTAQEDLLYAIFAGHGEFPKIVVAPGDQYEAFYRTIEVFNLAEKYRTPAIILEDKHLAESHRSVKSFPEEVIIERGKYYPRHEAAKMIKEGWVFKPYEITDDGVSPWVPPGTPGAIVKSDGNEHDEYGYVTIEQEIVTKMYMKRLRKEEYLRKDIEENHNPINVYGDIDESDIVILTWGSATLASREASKKLLKEGIRSSVVQIVYLSPFPRKTFELISRRCTGKYVLTIEYNATGQLAKLIRMETGYVVKDHIGKVDGRPFRASTLALKIKELYKR